MNKRKNRNKTPYNPQKAGLSKIEIKTMLDLKIIIKKHPCN